MLLAHMLEPDAPILNMAWRFDLYLPLDSARFARAFDTVAKARDALRVSIRDNAQFIHPEAQPFPPPLDLTSEKDPESAAAEWMEEEARLPFDLAQGTWRSRLLKLGEAHWVWFLCQHHVSTDAASHAALFRLVSAAYEGAVPPVATRLQELAARRPDSATRAFWKDRSDVLMPPPYGASRDGAGPGSRQILIPFGRDRSARLDVLAVDPDFRAVGVELSRFVLFATMHAAWLHRVSGTQSVVFGAPAHMRVVPSDREAMGLFVESLPLRLDVEEGETFRSLHAKMRNETLSWLRHARPGVTTTELAREVTGLFNYLNVRFGEFAGAPARTQWLHTGAYDPNQDYVLSVSRFDDDGYTIDARLNVDVFGRHAESVGDHWLRVADGFLDTPDAAIAHVSLGGEVVTGPEEPKGPTVLATFAGHARATPDRIAIEEGEAALSYAEFDALVSRYAAGFVRAGLRKDEPVLIWMRRGIAAVAAIWGAMRAGAAFVPLAADTPDARVRRLVEAHGIRLCVLDETTADRISLTPVIPADSPDHFDEVEPTDLAYCIFTSGSTGEPKGVMVDHDGLSRYAHWAAREHSGDYAFHSSLAFDLTLTSLIAPLISGRRIRVYPETGPVDLAVIDVFEDDAVDVVKLTPAHLDLVLQAGLRVDRISTLILGGAALSTDAARRAQSLSARGLTVANEYGPTEAVVGAMLHRFDPETDTAATVSIGMPADGVTIAVLDAGGNPVPPGIVGEIHISGRLSLGYLGRPDLTEQRFSTNGGRRFYRTGDLARIEATGRVSYLGREDEQIKVGGVRIEPAEIEKALLSLHGVTAAHVALWEPASFDFDAPACAKCGLSIQVPGTVLGEDGICGTCREFDAIRDRAEVYFDTPDVLAEKIAALRGKRSGRFDAIMLLSGGKDSTYALYRLAELTSDVLCLTLDNGFISDEAKANIVAVAEELDLEHRFIRTDEMAAIFRDSLRRFSNVCQGCFKTIYTLALRVALDEGIPAIVSGLSRGQFFETRLTPDLFNARAPSRQELEETVLEARKSYHGMDDAVARHLETRDLADAAIFEAVEFIDIYRYIDVPVSELYRFLQHRAWRRPSDTGRSTNCRINDLGIYVHTRREGFHNYAIPYAWDVRMGHKTRDQAMAELRDEIDPGRMRDLMTQIGLRPEDIAPKAQLAAWVAGKVSRRDVREALKAYLPDYMIPRRLAVLDALPLNTNGKIDSAALPEPFMFVETSSGYVEPENGHEKSLAGLMAEVLGRTRVGATENFYDMGGDSLSAIRIALLAEERGIALRATDVFQYQTVRALAAAIADRRPLDVYTADEEPLIELDEADLAAIRALDIG